jgi:TPR repeat protein
MRVQAQEGDTDAQFKLRLHSVPGCLPCLRVKQDDKEAIKWYRLAEARAQYNLGVSYGKGIGVVPQDYKEAIKWYRLAADQGFARAQYNLGLMYRDGKGVPQDYNFAHMWFNLASANGYKNAIKSRDIVAGRMTREDISEAQC